MDRILIILKKENGPRASSAPALGLNTIIFKYVYRYMKQISGERLQDHWSSGSLFKFSICIHNASNFCKLSHYGALDSGEITNYCVLAAPFPPVPYSCRDSKPVELSCACLQQCEQSPEADVQPQD